MHSAVLDATGYTLLLSSVIALAVLLWKGCRRMRKSPFYVLSASDVFSAALTAVILLVNHIEAGIRLSYNWQNGTDGDTPSRTWTNGDNYRFSFLKTDLRGAVDNSGEVELNVTLTCGMKDILMQYGMLLAALTNAFVSLLTMSVQCNFDAACMRRRCANVMKSLKNAQPGGPKDAEVKRRESEISENEQESQQDINTKTRSNIVQGLVKIAKFRTAKEDAKGPTSFLVTSHWLVPFLVVGILYFAEYNDMSNVRNTEDIECVLGSNFPINDLDTLSEADNPNVTGSVPPERNHLLNESFDSIKTEPSSVEIDEVVSKVQGIVRTELNYARNLTHAEDTGITSFPDTSGPQNLTRYILENNVMKYIKNITNNSVPGLNNALTQRNISVHNSFINNMHLKQDSEVPLFYDLSKSAEKLDATTSGSRVSQVSDDSYPEDAQTYLASTEGSTTRRTAVTSPAQNATSNSQIYSEIRRRIQAAGVHSAAKNHYSRPTSRPRDVEPEISSAKNHIAKRKPNSIEDLLSNDDRHASAGQSRQGGSLHMANECLVSTRFLKLQLFVLSFAIYFLPILLSCIFGRQEDSSSGGFVGGGHAAEIQERSRLDGCGCGEEGP